MVEQWQARHQGVDMGEASCTTESIPVGPTFGDLRCSRVTLPAVLSEPLRAPILSAPRILIVDNEPRILDILENLLIGHPRGFKIEIATDGAETLLKVGIFDPSLLILDVVMPRLHGIDVCRCLKANPKTCAIKIIGVTGYRHFVPAMRKAGADACLTKPFDLWQVEQVLDRLIA